MTSTLSDNELRCPTCEHRYRVPELRDDRTYLCVRCNEVLGGSTASTSRSLTSSTRRLQPLYGGHGPADGTVTPNPTAGGVLADQTWVEGDDGPSEEITEPELGAVGRYALQGELGRGGMGVVYRAFDADLGRSVAVKLLLHGGHAGQAQVERFLREARAGARLDHPNLVRVSDIGRHEGQVFFTMDLVDGPSVADVLAQGGRFVADEAARIVAEAARGVHHAHLSGIVHRDLKPGNVLLDVLGRALVTDFGLVKHVSGEGQQLTATGQVLGTPAYMAPEQAWGQPATARSDIYSLGAVLYEMLSGRPPYTGDNAAGILMKVVRQGPPTVQSITVNLPIDLALVCATAMERDPERRYRTAGELVDDLERWRRGEPILARAPTTAYRVQRWLRQHPRTTAVGAALLAVALLATGAGVATVVLEKRQETARLTQADAALTLLLTDLERLDAAGDPKTADRRLQSFVERDDVAFTPALSRAWLESAARAARDQDPERELSDLARAWRAAPDDPSLAVAGLAIARALRARWRFEALDAALATLVARVPATASNPQVIDLRLQAALGRGHLSNAAERASGLEIGPVLDALSRRIQTDRPARRLTLGDLDGDGGLEIIGTSESSLVRYEANLDLTPLATPAYREGRSAVSTLIAVPWAEGDRLLASSWQGNVSSPEIWALQGNRLVEELTWGGGYVHAAIAADLHQDGRPELYVGTGMGGRSLHRLDREADTWSVSAPHPATNSLNSDMVALVESDLDVDGTPELVAAASGWGAYDVRLYAASQDGGLDRIARYRVGETLRRSVEVLNTPRGPRLIVAKSRRLASLAAFPPDDPLGPPAGLYVLRFDGQSLHLEQSMLLADPAVADARIGLARLSVGDIDGDGLDDLLVGTRAPGFDGVWVARQLADGSFATGLIGDFAESLLHDIDGDGTAEMVVPSPSGISFRGVGDPVVDQTPPLALGATAADQLASIGLVRAAALAYEDAGDWMRAGAMWAEAKEPEQAALAYLDAHEHGVGSEALSAALAQQVRAHQFGPARETARALGQSPNALPNLEALADADELVYDFDEALDDRWRVHRPMGLAWDRTNGTLRAELMTWSGEVLSRPLTWDGEYLNLSVEMVLERGEWSTAPRIALVAPGDAALAERRIAVGAQTAGGGGLWERRAGCLGEGQLEARQVMDEVRRGDRPWNLRIELDYVRALDSIRCTVSVDGEVVSRGNMGSGTLPPGPLELTLYGAGETLDSAGALLAIDRIAVRGASEADPPAATGWSTGARHWVNRSPELALQAWKDARLEGDQPIALALAQAAAGDLAGAADTLPGWPDDAIPQVLQSAIRADPLRVGMLLGTVDPALPLEVMDQATLIAQSGHAREEWLGQLLDQGLTGLDTPRPDEPLETRVRRVRLLLSRGRVFREAGSAQASLQDFRRVLELATPDFDDPRVRRTARSAHKGLALALARDGDADGALEHARAAIELTDAKVRERDHLRTREELAPYRNLPEWRALLDDGPELLSDGTERRPIE